MSTALPDIVDSSGRPLKLGAAVGRGGEAAVYDVMSLPGIVAKIYHKPIDADRAAKIKAMPSIANDGLNKLASWPRDLLLNRQGQPIGLLIPKVLGKDAHHLCSPKSRANEFPGTDWRFLIRAATNIARAFAVVHDIGCVIGDVNYGGVLIAPDATVKLIDCDSFQVTLGGKRYPCTVGVPTFTPPELQRKSFASVVRTANHDNFGLAIITFLMLFNGRHPFAGRFMGAGDMPIEKAIEEVRFVFGSRHQSVQMMRPPATPELSSVGPDVMLLFERAFARENIAGGRPNARDWVSGLTAMEKDVKQCSSNASHWHHKSTACPWCPIENATGSVLFSVSVRPTSMFTTFDLAGIWKQVEAVTHPGAAPVIAGGVLPQAGQSGLSFKKVLPWVVGLFFAIVGMNGGGGWMFVLAAVSVFGLPSMLAPDKEKLKAAQERNRQATVAWDSAFKDWDAQAGPRTFDAKFTDLTLAKRQLESLPTRRIERLDELRRSQRQLQLDRFLDLFEIDKAKIEGIGPGRTQMLESYGIETAADIKRSTLQSVPGFGPKMQQRLLNWRGSVEGKFRFDPNKGVDPRDTAKVEADILSEKVSLEGKLLKGHAELTQIRVQIIAARERLRQRVDHAHANAVEADRDLRSLW
jgi:DNA-binding helix-hairpin-helix protein with protein kinase domain